jgi:hypothetical protein
MAPGWVGRSKEPCLEEMTAEQPKASGLSVVGWCGMAKNLLAWAPNLTHQDCKAIAYAMRNYGPPENNLTRYANYLIAAAERRIIFLSDPKVVIAALLKAEADKYGLGRS